MSQFDTDDIEIKKILDFFRDVTLRVGVLENQIASLRIENAKLTHDIQDMKDIFNLKIDSLDSILFKLQRTMQKNENRNASLSDIAPDHDTAI